jgi:magnesium transporter
MSGMEKILIRRKKSAGLPPGTIQMPESGSPDGRQFRITVINYDSKTHNQTVAVSLQDAITSIEKNNNTWIHMECPGSAEVIEQLGEVFEIHHLYLEDMLHLDQRPKIDDLGTHLFIVFRHFEWVNGDLIEEQISLLLGNNYLFSLQNSNNTVFSTIMERIRGGRGVIRGKKIDFLLYALLDIVIDNYFSVIETLGEKMENLEEELLGQPDRRTVNALYSLKNRILFVQKALIPMREIVFSLRRSESKLITRENHPFFSDLADHMLQLVESITTYRDILSNMFDVYLTSQNNKLSEVMKVLTLISTIFIPLSFITGIFGMNFSHMPILERSWGYPLVMFGCGAIALGMVIYYKIKKWF